MPDKYDFPRYTTFEVYPVLIPFSQWHVAANDEDGGMYPRRA